MPTLRFIDPVHWNAIENHLANAPVERFAFALTRVLTDGPDGPTLQVEDFELVHDEEVERDLAGSTIRDTALDRVHNRAITESRGLVEFHNHGHGPPGFSRTDEAALQPMAEYVVNLLDGRPYGAAVWTRDAVHADWFRSANATIQRGVFRSV